jgi:ribulose-phosphate 3-epimerase
VILPSMLLCDFGNLEKEVERLRAAEVEALHLDVMDGHFVDNLTYGLPIVSAFRRLTDLPLDVHLMISEPGKYIEPFLDAGADSLTIHIEAEPEPGPLLKRMRQLGSGVGLALNPQTPVSRVEPYLADCDLILVMSVEPGFGGQKFEPVALEKLRHLRRVAPQALLLEIDGGVNETTIAGCAAAGAQMFVTGSAIFKHSDYAESVARLSRLVMSQGVSTH